LEAIVVFASHHGLDIAAHRDTALCAKCVGNWRSILDYLCWRLYSQKTIWLMEG